MIPDEVLHFHSSDEKFPSGYPVTLHSSLGSSVASGASTYAPAFAADETVPNSDRGPSLLSNVKDTHFPPAAENWTLSMGPQQT